MDINHKRYLYIYIATLLLAYLVLFYYEYVEITIDLWIVVVTLTGISAIFELTPIVLPTSGRISLIIPLLFAAGTNFGIFPVLFISLFVGLILLIINRSRWKVNIFNSLQYGLASYLGMITYNFLKINKGSFTLDNFYAFISFAILFFITNVVLTTIYSFLEEGNSIVSILNVALDKNSLLVYFTMMSLGVLVAIVFKAEGLSGVVFFSIVMWGLSISYRSYYKVFDHFRSLSGLDEVTGLYNHRYFQETLGDLVNKNNKVSLLLIDLDWFKHYNDICGHPKGDKLLKNIGELFRDIVGDKGVICRYGGDEFAVILPDTTSDHALLKAEEIRKVIAEFNFEGKENMPDNRFSVSIGVSTYPDMAGNKEELINSADEALYNIKYTSRNKVQLYSSIFEELKANLKFQEKEEEVISTIKTFLTIVNSKDRYTYGHTERIMHYAEMLAKKLSLSDDEIKIVRYSALLHDIGKIEVPVEVLNKRKPLTEEELELVKHHVIWSEEIVKPIDELSACLPIIRHHHERFDGKGYPDQLFEGQIPLLARILTIADSYDAMTTNRPYQNKKTREEAIGELKKNAGKQFDPNLVKPFIEVINDI